MFHSQNLSCCTMYWCTTTFFYARWTRMATRPALARQQTGWIIAPRARVCNEQECRVLEDNVWRRRLGTWARCLTDKIGNIYGQELAGDLFPSELSKLFICFIFLIKIQGLLFTWGSCSTLNHYRTKWLCRVSGALGKAQFALGKGFAECCTRQRTLGKK